MAKNLLCAAFLLTLAAVTAHAQTVTLRACNSGKTDVDVYFAQGANVVSQQVAPSYCAALAYTQGAMEPGLVAVGPLGGAPEFTRCDDFTYDVNVLAFPDTREVAFQSFCQICDDHAEERKTPEQRATEKQIADLKQALVNNLPLGMRINIERDTQRQDSREESNDRYREMLERDPTKWDRIGWSDVPRYASDVAGNVPNVAMQGSVAVLQGTVTGMQRHNASDPYYDVFFQESPDHKFILCTQKPDVLSDIFGANYGTAMVGKKIEVEGRVVQCLGAPGILLKLAHQIKLVGTGPGMVASVTPPAFRFPEDPEHPSRTAVPSPPTREQIAAATAQTVGIVGGEMYRRAQCATPQRGEKAFVDNSVWRRYFGAAQRQFAASFRSPEPLYSAACG